MCQLHGPVSSLLVESAQVCDLASFFGDFRRSEELSEIKQPLIDIEDELKNSIFNLKVRGKLDKMCMGILLCVKNEFGNS